MNVEIFWSCKDYWVERNRYIYPKIRSWPFSQLKLQYKIFCNANSYENLVISKCIVEARHIKILEQEMLSVSCFNVMKFMPHHLCGQHFVWSEIFNAGCYTYIPQCALSHFIGLIIENNVKSMLKSSTLGVLLCFNTLERQATSCGINFIASRQLTDDSSCSKILIWRTSTINLDITKFS